MFSSPSARPSASSSRPRPRMPMTPKPRRSLRSGESSRSDADQPASPHVPLQPIDLSPSASSPSPSAQTPPKRTNPFTTPRSRTTSFTSPSPSPSSLSMRAPMSNSYSSIPAPKFDSTQSSAGSGAYTHPPRSPTKPKSKTRGGDATGTGLLSVEVDDEEELYKRIRYQGESGEGGGIMQDIVLGPHVVPGELNLQHTTWAHGFFGGDKTRLSAMCSIYDPEIPGATDAFQKEIFLMSSSMLLRQYQGTCVPYVCAAQVVEPGRLAVISRPISYENWDFASPYTPLVLKTKIVQFYREIHNAGILHGSPSHSNFWISRLPSSTVTPSALTPQSYAQAESKCLIHIVDWSLARIIDPSGSIAVAPNASAHPPLVDWVGGFTRQEMKAEEREVMFLLDWEGRRQKEVQAFVRDFEGLATAERVRVRRLAAEKRSCERVEAEEREVMSPSEYFASLAGSGSGSNRTSRRLGGSSFNNLFDSLRLTSFAGSNLQPQAHEVQDPHTGELRIFDNRLNWFWTVEEVASIRAQLTERPPLNNNDEDARTIDSDALLAHLERHTLPEQFAARFNIVPKDFLAECDVAPSSWTPTLPGENDENAWCELVESEDRRRGVIQRYGIFESRSAQQTLWEDDERQRQLDHRAFRVKAAAAAGGALPDRFSSFYPGQKYLMNPFQRAVQLGEDELERANAASRASKQDALQGFFTEIEGGMDLDLDEGALLGKEDRAPLPLPPPSAPALPERAGTPRPGLRRSQADDQLSHDDRIAPQTSLPAPTPVRAAAKVEDLVPLVSTLEKAPSATIISERAKASPKAKSPTSPTFTRIRKSRPTGDMSPPSKASSSSSTVVVSTSLDALGPPAPEVRQPTAPAALESSATCELVEVPARTDHKEGKMTKDARFEAKEAEDGYQASLALLSSQALQAAVGGRVLSEQDALSVVGLVANPVMINALKLLQSFGEDEADRVTFHPSSYAELQSVTALTGIFSPSSPPPLTPPPPFKSSNSLTSSPPDASSDSPAPSFSSSSPTPVSPATFEASSRRPTWSPGTPGRFAGRFSSFSSTTSNLFTAPDTQTSHSSIGNPFGLPTSATANNPFPSPSSSSASPFSESNPFRPIRSPFPASGSSTISPLPQPSTPFPCFVPSQRTLPPLPPIPASIHADVPPNTCFDTAAACKKELDVYRPVPYADTEEYNEFRLALAGRQGALQYIESWKPSQTSQVSTSSSSSLGALETSSGSSPPSPANSDSAGSDTTVVGSPFGRTPPHALFGGNRTLFSEFSTSKEVGPPFGAPWTAGERIPLSDVETPSWPPPASQKRLPHRSPEQRALDVVEAPKPPSQDSCIELDTAPSSSPPEAKSEHDFREDPDVETSSLASTPEDREEEDEVESQLGPVVPWDGSIPETIAPSAIVALRSSEVQARWKRKFAEDEQELVGCSTCSQSSGDSVGLTAIRDEILDRRAAKRSRIF